MTIARQETRRRAHFLLSALWWSLTVGCGVESASEPQTAADVDSTDEPDDSSDVGFDEPETEADPVDAQCADGSCGRCGDGLCPTGYYCDETSEPACSWIPKCVSQNTCECVLDVLGSDCQCEEKGDGLHVTCS